MLLTTLPPDVHTLPLPGLEGHRTAILTGIAARQRVIGAIRRNDGAIRLSGERFDRLCVLRSERARLQNQLRRLHELIEATCCEESFTPSPTPSST